MHGKDVGEQLRVRHLMSRLADMGLLKGPRLLLQWVQLVWWDATVWLRKVPLMLRSRLMQASWSKGRRQTGRGLKSGLLVGKRAEGARQRWPNLL